MPYLGQKDSQKQEAFDADVMFYRISTYHGASGSGIFDDKGRLVGSSSCLFKLAK